MSLLYLQDCGTFPAGQSQILNSEKITHNMFWLNLDNVQSSTALAAFNNITKASVDEIYRE